MAVNHPIADDHLAVLAPFAAWRCQLIASETAEAEVERVIDGRTVGPAA